MPTDEVRYLHGTLRESWTKYVYFLLAAAASAIALAVSLTQETYLQLSQIPLGLAVLAWGLSFFFGCRSVFNRNVSLGINADAVVLGLGRKLPPEADQMLREGAGRYDSKAATYMRWQFGTLIFGALSFLVWHILEMIARIPETPAA